MQEAEYVARRRTVEMALRRPPMDRHNLEHTGAAAGKTLPQYVNLLWRLQKYATCL